MIMTNKLLPVALIAALIGGSVGALVMHKSQPASAETLTAAQTTPVATTDQQTANEMIPAQFNTAGQPISGQSAPPARRCDVLRVASFIGTRDPERRHLAFTTITSRASEVSGTSTVTN